VVMQGAVVQHRAAVQCSMTRLSLVYTSSTYLCAAFLHFNVLMMASLPVHYDNSLLCCAAV
jgi:hypothetical protein